MKVTIDNEHKTYYWCDPSKNTSCPKRSCYVHNGPCHCTLQPKYGIQDAAGEPIALIFRDSFWHNAEAFLPPESDEWTQVLIVKELKSGERKLEIAQYLKAVGWVTSNGKGKVLYWMPLPGIPKN